MVSRITSSLGRGKRLLGRFFGDLLRTFLPQPKATHIRYLKTDNTLGFDPNGSGLWTPASRAVLGTGVLAWTEDRWTPKEREAKLVILEKLDDDHRARDRIETSIMMSVFALVVPLVVLLSGLLVRWVVRGFYARQP